MKKSVLILALGDIYWTRFALGFSRLLTESGIRCVIAMESRAGEYQAYWRRCDYIGAEIYYLTDFINSSDVSENGNVLSVMGDYLRVSTLGQKRKLYDTNWSAIAATVNKFTNHIMNSESIGLIVGDQVSTSLSYNFCEAAAKYGIEYWGLAGSRLAGRYVIAKFRRNEDVVVNSIYYEIVNGVKKITPEE